MKRASLSVTLLFCLVIGVFSVLFWALPDRSISDAENRPLEQLPTLSAKNLFSGKFRRSLADYYADQFPLRDTFVGIKATSELALGKGENDGILRGEGGELARRFFRLPAAGEICLGDAYDETDVREKCAVIRRLFERVEIPSALLLPGRAIDVKASSFSYPDEGSRTLLEELQRGLAGTPYGELNERLRLIHDRGGEVYYRTDHHWTTRGAYLAYCEVMERLGMAGQILPEEDFAKQTVSENFYGTLASAGGFSPTPDRVELWLTGQEEGYLVIADGKELRGLYDFSALEGRDHYSIFLGGVHDVIEVKRKDGAPRPKLLLVKDSFANSLAPFLAEHFDLILLNLASPRSDFSDVSGAIAAYRPDAFLLVWSVENLLVSERTRELR